jgi:hypothetical protein
MSSTDTAAPDLIAAMISGPKSSSLLTRPATLATPGWVHSRLISKVPLASSTSA